MATEWQERCSAVIGCVFRVLCDAADTLTELKEHLLKTGDIGPLGNKTWPHTGFERDAKACVLDNITRRLCDMANAVRNADKTIIVEKSAVPAAFENIKKCIEDMGAQVDIVEKQYAGDCEELKKSMVTAVTALETYLENEKTEEKTVAQLVQDLGKLVDDA
jgi:hypothetical protein